MGRTFLRTVFALPVPVTGRFSQLPSKAYGKTISNERVVNVFAAINDNQPMHNVGSKVVKRSVLNGITTFIKRF